MKQRRIIYAVALLFSMSVASAQGFSPITKWQQIKTPHFSILFDAPIEKDAQRVANTLEHLYEASAKNMPRKPEPITIVLSNYSTSPNGFVTLAPRRSEWETTPYWPTTFDLVGSGDWLSLLAVHEFRHVVQFDQFSTGWFRLAKLLGGEGGVSVLSGIMYPTWFFEGDATAMETVLSDYGRGRNPSFGLHLRALELAGKRYSYPKAYFGSVKDPSINPYDMGYYMTSFVKRKYGQKAWGKIIETSNRTFLPYLTFTLSANLLKHTKLNEPALYHRTLDDVGGKWQDQLAQTRTEEAVAITKPTKQFTSYNLPQILGNGDILAIKEGVADPLQFVALDANGNEVSHFGAESMVNIHGFHAKGEKLVWSSVIPDARYKRVGKTVVKMRNLKTGSVKTLSEEGYWFSPVLSHDETKIAVISSLPNLQHTICILDANTGGILQQLPVPNNEQPSRLVWLPDGKTVAMNRQGTKGKAISLLDITSGKVEDVLPHVWESTLLSTYWNGYLLYTSPLNGVDNVYALELSTKKRFQITSAPLAAQNPTVSGNNLIFSNYTASGYQLASLALNPANWKPAETVKDQFVAYYAPLIEQEQGKSILQDVPNNQYPVSKVGRSKTHVHSWNLNIQRGLTTVSLTGSDILGTRRTSISGVINSNAGQYGGKVTSTLMARHPALSFSIGREFREEGSIFLNKKSWNENSLGLGLAFPYNLSRGTTSRSLNIGLGLQAAYLQNIEAMPFNRDWAFPASISFDYHSSKPKAKMDVANRNAWGLNALIQQAKFGNLKGEKITIMGALNLPGIGKHSVLQLSGFYTNRKDNGYRFPKSIFYAEPFTISASEDSNLMAYAKAHYIFPLAYPEWSLGRMFYMRDLKANLLVGATHEILDDGLEHVAVGLSSALNFLNLPVPFEVGGYLVYDFRFSSFKLMPSFNIKL